MIDSKNFEVCEERKETVKELLDNMGGILAEMEHEVIMISEAVYRGRNTVPKEPLNDLEAVPPMLVIMRGHRDLAEAVLKEIKEIREALW